MASALEKILKGTLEKSDSQKAFSPWWEDVEDKLLYSLMIFGMITLPFNMVSNSPVVCTLDETRISLNNMTNAETMSMKFFLRLYLGKFCTVHFISQKMIFLPFILILCPLPLVAVGRLFLRYFKVEKKMDTFYKLLVKESLDREDVEAMEKENVKDCLEIVQMFRHSNGIYHALICRTVVQIIFGGFVSALLLTIYFYELTGSNVQCELYNKPYTCVVPLADFYRIIVLLSNVSIDAFIFCSMYNMVWIMVPRISPFYSFMMRSRNYIDRAIDKEHLELKSRQYTRCLSMLETAEPFFDLYFDETSRDLPLLITLLAARNGAADALRLLALFDKDFQKLWKPLDVTIQHEVDNSLADSDVVHVEWNDAPIADYIESYRGRVSPLHVEYTLEVLPKAESALRNRLFAKDDICGPLAMQMGKTKYRETFYGVEMGKGESGSDTKKEEDKKKGGSGGNATSEPRVVISTEVNGRTIAQFTEKIVPQTLVQLSEDGGNKSPELSLPA